MLTIHDYAYLTILFHTNRKWFKRLSDGQKRSVVRRVEEMLPSETPLVDKLSWFRR